MPSELCSVFLQLWYISGPSNKAAEATRQHPHVVCSWRLTDILFGLPNVRFGCKADVAPPLDTKLRLLPGELRTGRSIFRRRTADRKPSSVETVFTYLMAACRVSWIPSTAAVRAGDDFKQVAVRVFEVDTASAVVVIDLT